MHLLYFWLSIVMPKLSIILCTRLAASYAHHCQRRVVLAVIRRYVVLACDFVNECYLYLLRAVNAFFSKFRIFSRPLFVFIFYLVDSDWNLKFLDELILCSVCVIGNSILRFCSCDGCCHHNHGGMGFTQI